MSLLKGTMDRTDGQPKYSYSVDERENSFDVKKEDWSLEN